MPPAACIADDAVITAMMMKNASIGGEPGGRWKTNTRITVPTTPQRPRPMPPVRTPITIAPRTTDGLQDHDEDFHCCSLETPTDRPAAAVTQAVIRAGSRGTSFERGDAGRGVGPLPRSGGVSGAIRVHYL